jgi:hypothetical protein
VYNPEIPKRSGKEFHKAFASDEKKNMIHPPRQKQGFARAFGCATTLMKWISWISEAAVLRAAREGADAVRRGVLKPGKLLF